MSTPLLPPYTELVKWVPADRQDRFYRLALWPDLFGLVADGTGILLNNELDDFAAKAGAPNAYGLGGGDANAPGPRKRPLSSMAPTIVFRDGKLLLVTGTPGGRRIPTIVLQVNIFGRALRATVCS